VSELLKQASQQIKSRAVPGHAMDKEQMRYAEEVMRFTEHEIEKILTPSEFEDYLLHHSQEGRDLARKLLNVSVTDEEMRKFLSASRDYDEKYGYYTALMDPSSGGAQRAQDEQNYADMVRATLGDDRYVQYLRNSGRQFAAVDSFASANSLDAHTAVELYSVEAGVQRQVVSINGSSDSLELRQQKVTEVLNAAEQQLAGVLDDGTREKYLQSGAGQWLKDIRSNPTGKPRHGEVWSFMTVK